MKKLPPLSRCPSCKNTNEAKVRYKWERKYIEPYVKSETTCAFCGTFYKGWTWKHISVPIRYWILAWAMYLVATFVLVIVGIFALFSLFMIVERL